MWVKAVSQRRKSETPIMKRTSKTILFKFFIALVLCCSSVQAADITSEVKSQTGGFLELGIGLGYGRAAVAGFYESDVANENFEQLSLTVLVNGQWQWRSLFVEALHDSFTGVALGVQAWQNQDYSIDAIVTNLFADLDPADSGFEGLNVRKYDVVAGLRSTHHLDNSVLQFSVLGDVSGTHNGWAASANYGRFWQRRNWNFHAIGGALYFSDKVLDHFFGVTAAEANTDIPAFKVDAGVLIELEIGATFPLSEKWVFKSTAEYYRLPNKLFDSPLVSEKYAYTLLTSINYVF